MVVNDLSDHIIFERQKKLGNIQCARGLNNYDYTWGHTLHSHPPPYQAINEQLLKSISIQNRKMVSLPR